MMGFLVHDGKNLIRGLVIFIKVRSVYAIK